MDSTTKHRRSIKGHNAQYAQHTIQANEGFAVIDTQYTNLKHTLTLNK